MNSYKTARITNGVSLRLSNDRDLLAQGCYTKRTKKLVNSPWRHGIHLQNSAVEWRAKQSFRVHIILGLNEILVRYSGTMQTWGTREVCLFIDVEWRAFGTFVSLRNHSKRRIERSISCAGLSAAMDTISRRRRADRIHIQVGNTRTGARACYIPKRCMKWWRTFQVTHGDSVLSPGLYDWVLNTEWIHVFYHRLRKIHRKGSWTLIFYWSFQRV